MKVPTSVGIRQFKHEASELIRRAEAGETFTITDRGRPIVHVGPVSARGPTEEDRLAAAVRAGRLTWSGGKPRGLERPVRSSASVADAVVEDRR